MSKLYIIEQGEERFIRVTARNLFSKEDLIMCGKPPSCSICMEDESLPGEQKYFICLPCDHIFHADCLIKWLNDDEKHTCPLCRDDGVENMKTRDSCDWFQKTLLDHSKNSKELEDPNCYICRNQFDCDKWLKLECGHEWHYDCFKRWTNSRNVCPLDNISPIYQ